MSLRNYTRKIDRYSPIFMQCSISSTVNIERINLLWWLNFVERSNAANQISHCPASTGALVTLSSHNSVLGAKVPIVRAKRV